MTTQTEIDDAVHTANSVAVQAVIGHDHDNAVATPTGGDINSDFTRDYTSNAATRAHLEKVALVSSDAHIMENYRP